MPVWVLFLQVTPTVQSIDCPDLHFWAQNIFSANDRFLVDISSQQHYEQFKPQKVPVLVLFLQVTPKVQSIYYPHVHFWAQNIFSANDRFLLEI